MVLAGWGASLSILACCVWECQRMGAGDRSSYCSYYTNRYCDLSQSVVIHNGVIGWL